MKLIECYLTKNECYKARKTITPFGVMVHSTGANNPRLKRYVQPNVGGIGLNTNKNDWNRGGVYKCVHAFIGKLEDGSVATVQTLPWNYRSWHCGMSANNTHISFEICEDGLTDASYFKAVYQEAVDLTAMLCKKYNLDPLKDGVVIDHSEGAKRNIASGHADVSHWFPKHGKTMDDFRNDVSKAMGNNASKGGSTVNVTLDVLKRGSKTQSVKALQVLLDGKGFACGKADGSFGPATESAVKKFQEANKLSVDGIVGAQTWTCLLG